MLPLLSVVAWMMYSWLLFCYGGEEIWIACLDGLVSVGLLAAAGFLYGYVDGTIHALQIQVALAVLVQAISLAGAFELQVLLERGNVGDFMDSECVWRDCPGFTEEQAGSSPDVYRYRLYFWRGRDLFAVGLEFADAD